MKRLQIGTPGGGAGFYTPPITTAPAAAIPGLDRVLFYAANSGTEKNAPEMNYLHVGVVIRAPSGYMGRALAPAQANGKAGNTPKIITGRV